MKRDINGKKKVSPAAFTICAAASGFAGYILSAGCGENVDIFTYFNTTMEALGNPFRSGYWNWSYSPYGVCLGMIAGELAFLLYVSSQKNYMKGKEYGSAQYAIPEQVHAELADLSKDPHDPQNICVYQQKRFLFSKKTDIAVVNTRNRMVTKHVQMTLDTRHTDLNNNVLVIGGSGAGKSFRYVKPNLMNCSSSFICTDPKGELMQSSAGFLKSKGYQVKALNLLNETGMKKSTRYNPFKYLQSDADVLKLVSNFMSNTKKSKDSGGGNDDFWEQSAANLLNALVFYTWYEGVEIEGVLHKDFKGVVYLLRKAEFKEDPQTGAKIDSELDEIFNELEEKEARLKEADPARPEHQALIYYNQTMRGAADTVRSIIQTLNARTGCLQNETVLNLLSEDEMDIESIGEQKTVIYCVIPDNDKTFNFLIGMLYSQMFQILYYQADFVHNGRLPVHVTFMLDEFANVALPDDFCSLLSTMRSREISSCIIIQNLAQIKAMFKDTWETIPGNCDTLIYLGGNEQGTHKYISEMLGKRTIDKSSSSTSKGKNGSTSKSEDVLGRELLLPEEVRKVKGKKCIVFIRGYDPIFDDKIDTLHHPHWKEFRAAAKTYQFDARIERYNQMVAMGIDPKTKQSNGVGKIYDLAEIRMKKQQDNAAMSNYKEEKNVAEKLGGEIPEEPKTQVISLTIEQLFAIPDGGCIDSLGRQKTKFSTKADSCQAERNAEIFENIAEKNEEIRIELEGNEVSGTDVKEEDESVFANNDASDGWGDNTGKQFRNSTDAFEQSLPDRKEESTGGEYDILDELYGTTESTTESSPMKKKQDDRLARKKNKDYIYLEKQGYQEEQIRVLLEMKERGSSTDFVHSAKKFVPLDMSAEEIKAMIETFFDVA